MICDTGLYFMRSLAICVFIFWEISSQIIDPLLKQSYLGFVAEGFFFVCVWLREDILKIKSTKSSLNTITFKNTSSKINNFHSHYYGITFDAGRFSYVRIQVLFYI